MPRPRSSISRHPDRGSPVVRPRETSAETSEQAAAAALTLQFLDYVADGRTYGETMEAWRSTCPRMPIWEDAVRHGLVRIENGGAMNASRIVLTALGTARLRRPPVLPYPSPSSGRVVERSEVAWGSLGRRGATPTGAQKRATLPEDGEG
jgi:hypothetical protein